MKVLVFGSNGFIGREVVSQLVDSEFDVTLIDRSSTDIRVDLTNKEQVVQALKTVRPDAIINCAGIIENSEKARLNKVMSMNILIAMHELNMTDTQLVLLGSASVYGVVEEGIPTPENAKLNPVSIYGEHKLDEEVSTIDYANARGLKLVVARVFNPIGKKMGSKLLLSNVISKVIEQKNHKSIVVEVSRLDSSRDYISVGDVARALTILATNKSKHDIYNVGSGKSHTNQQLIQYVLGNIKDISKKNVKMVETRSDPELKVASKANIKRIKEEHGWKPQDDIKRVIKELMDEY